MLASPYTPVILAVLLVDFALEVTADLLNLHALDAEVPPELRRIYDPDRFRRAQAYTRARTRFGLVSRTVDLFALLACWFAGGFALLDAWTRGLGLGPIPTGLVFVAVLTAGRGALGLPFHWWSTFVIEERFGFNRTAHRTFWVDVGKGLLLAVVLGAPLLAAVLGFFARAGALAWVWCWLATTLFMLAVQFVAPTWIMPLFNRFTPLADGPLRDAILRYAGAVGFPLEGVFVIDGSRRSTKANAFFTGFGRRKRIALFDTLVQKLEPEELVGVVAHEIGHYKRGHVVKGLAVAIAETGLLFFLLSRFLSDVRLFRAFGVSVPSVHAGLVFFGLLFTPASVLVGIGVHAFSRRNELEADAFARRTTGSGARLGRALEKLSADALANPTPHPLQVILRYSHPPLRDRLRALAAET